MANMGEETGEGVVVGRAVAQSDPPYPLASGTQAEPSDAPWVVREEPILTTRQVGKRTETNTKRPGSIADSRFIPETPYIWDDEPCSNYREMDLLDPEWKTYRRYLLCWGLRRDGLAEFIYDMGERHPRFGTQVNIVGGQGRIIVESFATMKEIADKWRVMEMPMPHQNFEMNALERSPDLIELRARRVI